MPRARLDWNARWRPLGDQAAPSLSPGPVVSRRSAEPAGATGQPGAAARNLRAEGLQRKNFNTIKTEELVKSQWSFEGPPYRIESAGGTGSGPEHKKRVEHRVR